MDKRVFQEFAGLLYRAAGIVLNSDKQPLLKARLAGRLRALGLRDPSEYLNVLKRDREGSERQRFLDAITTNFTHFFREPRHFTLLQDWLTSWPATPGRPLRMWCAAAATGEEPYSMAIATAEAGCRDFKLLASDISWRALEVAKRGQYPAERIEPLSREQRNRYFAKVADAPSEYRVRPFLRDRILFRRINLAAPPFPIRGDLDVVFCRNVMIYFDAAVRTRLLREIAALMRPGGLLAIGHCETIVGHRQFGLRLLSTSFYRKDAHREPRQSERVDHA